MLRNWLVIWSVNGVDGAGWKAAAGRSRMPLGRYELLLLSASWTKASAVVRRGEEQIPDFLGNFRRKGCYHVVKAGPIVGNVSCGELGLNLRKPNFWIR